MKKKLATKKKVEAKNGASYLQMPLVFQSAVFLLFLFFFLFLTLGSCSDRYDRFDTSESARPSFSSDTVRLDTLYSRVSSATHRLVVYNQNQAALKLSHITLRKHEESAYRINVDGRSGTSFADLIIPAKDSIYVFIEATFPEGAEDFPVEQTAEIAFRCNGKEQTVRLEGWRLNIDHATSLFVQQDTTMGERRPLFIRDSIVVAEGVTLTLAPGTHFLMGNKAQIKVFGTLKAEGTVEKRILIEGLRRDNLVADVNYRLIPGQWEELFFAGTSRGNSMRYSTVRNGRGGVVVGRKEDKEGANPDLYLEGCRFTNMKINALRATNANITALNCEFSNAMAACLELTGGKCQLNFSTVAGFYAFDHRQSPAIKVNTPEGVLAPSLILSYSVVDGTFAITRVKDKVPTGGEIFFDEKNLNLIELRSSYLKAPFEIFPSSSGCIEANQPADSVYLHVGRDLQKNKHDFIYDYRPRSKAPFVGKGGEMVPPSDLLGKPRLQAATWGAYEPSPEDEKPKENK